MLDIISDYLYGYGISVEVNLSNDGAKVELINERTGNVILFCKRASVDDALAVIVCKCINDVAMVKAELDPKYSFVDSDLEGL